MLAAAAPQGGVCAALPSAQPVAFPSPSLRTLRVTVGPQQRSTLGAPRGRTEPRGGTAPTSRTRGSKSRLGADVPFSHARSGALHALKGSTQDPLEEGLPRRPSDSAPPPPTVGELPTLLSPSWSLRFSSRSTRGLQHPPLVGSAVVGSWRPARRGGGFGCTTRRCAAGRTALVTRRGRDPPPLAAALPTNDYPTNALHPCARHSCLHPPPPPLQRGCCRVQTARQRTLAAIRHLVPRPQPSFKRGSVGTLRSARAAHALM